MKPIHIVAFICIAAWAATTHARAAAEPANQPAPAKPDVVMVRITSADGECKPIVLEGNGVWVTDDNQQVALAAAGSGDPADGSAGPKVVRKLRINSGDGSAVADVQGDVLFVHDDDSGLKAGGPWLGVQFSPVPRPVAAQLKLEDGVGLMIGNVFEGSPADLAGLQQFDVMIAIDGQKASNNIGEFIDKVRAFAPGENHAFTLVRGGQTVTASVTVGARPAPDAMPRPKYESEVEEMVGGNVFGRGGMLQKDATGNWTFKGFNLPDVPDVMKMIPDVSDMDFKFNLALPDMGGGSQQVYVGKSQGKSIRIEKKDDGPLTVTTTETVNGNTNTTTNTYATEDELKAADPEAAKLLESGPTMHFFARPLDGNFRFNFGDAFKGDFFKGHEEAMKRAEEAMKMFHERKADTLGFGPGAHGIILRKAKTSFETQPDGKIRVTIRSGDDERVEVFDNAEALQSQRPGLYEKYQALEAQK